jgi:hypothetical protein
MAGQFTVMDNSEIKELLDTLPKILLFGVNESVSSVVSTGRFTLFNDLPEDVRYKIGNMTQSSSLFRTEKSFLSSIAGKEVFYDTHCISRGIGLDELNNYIKNLPKNTKTNILSLLIFKGDNMSYEIRQVEVIIELATNNKLIIHENDGQIHKLVSYTSFIDYCIIRSGVSNMDLVTVLFDFNTINGIVANRKKCMEVDNLYNHKYTYSYIDAALQHFRDYFGPLSLILRMNIIVWGYGLPDSENPYSIENTLGLGTLFFASDDDRLQHLISSKEFVLSNLSGKNDKYVDERFLL